MNGQALRWGSCAVTATLFAVSCIVPATGTCNPDGSIRDAGARGWEWLAMGWAGPLVGLFGWFANLFWLYAFVQLLRGRRPSAFPGLAALLLAVSSIAIPQSFNLPFDDIHTLHLCHPQIGYFCWILALSVPLFLSRPPFAAMRRSRKEWSG